MQSKYRQLLLTYVLVFEDIFPGPVGQVVLEMNTTIYLELCTPVATQHGGIYTHLGIIDHAIPVPYYDCAWIESPHGSRKRRDM